MEGEDALDDPTLAEDRRRKVSWSSGKKKQCDVLFVVGHDRKNNTNTAIGKKLIESSPFHKILFGSCSLPCILIVLRN